LNLRKNTKYKFRIRILEMLLGEKLIERINILKNIVSYCL